MTTIPTDQVKTLNFRSVVVPNSMQGTGDKRHSMVVYQTGNTGLRHKHSWEQILETSYLAEMAPPPMCFCEDKKYLVDLSKTFAQRHGYKLVVKKNDSRRCILLCDHHHTRRKKVDGGDKCQFKVELQYKSKKRHWLLKPVEPRHSAHRPDLHYGKGLCHALSHKECAFQLGVEKTGIQMDNLPVIRSRMEAESEIDEVLRHISQPKWELQPQANRKVVVSGLSADLTDHTPRIVRGLTQGMWPHIPVECQFSAHQHYITVEVKYLDTTERLFQFAYDPDTLDDELQRIRQVMESIV